MSFVCFYLFQRSLLSAWPLPYAVPCACLTLPDLTLPYPCTSHDLYSFFWKGLMGHGIAQIAAHAGFQVLAIEATDTALNIGITRYCKAVAVMLWRERHQYKITWTKFIFHGDLHDWDAKWHSSSCWLLLPWFTSVCLSQLQIQWSIHTHSRIQKSLGKAISKDAVKSGKSEVAWCSPMTSSSTCPPYIIHHCTDSRLDCIPCWVLKLYHRHLSESELF